VCVEGDSAGTGSDTAWRGNGGGKLGVRTFGNGGGMLLTLRAGTACSGSGGGTLGVFGLACGARLRFGGGGGS